MIAWTSPQRPPRTVVINCTIKKFSIPIAARRSLPDPLLPQIRFFNMSVSPEKKKYIYLKKGRSETSWESWIKSTELTPLQELTTQSMQRKSRKTSMCPAQPAIKVRRESSVKISANILRMAWKSKIKKKIKDRFIYITHNSWSLIFINNIFFMHEKSVFHLKKWKMMAYFYAVLKIHALFM